MEQPPPEQEAPQAAPACETSSTWMWVGIVFIGISVILLIAVLYLVFSRPSIPVGPCPDIVISAEDVAKVDAAIAYIDKFQERVGILAGKGCQPSQCVRR